LRAAIYTRISSDRDGTGLGVRRPNESLATVLMALQSIVSFVVVGSVTARPVSVPS
jgi:hypothetical protein